MGDAFFQVLGFLLVFGAIVFLAYVVTRMIGKKAGAGMKGKHIQVLDSVSVGLDRQLLLVRAGGKVFLLSSSGKQLTMLAEVPLDEDAENVVSSDTASADGFRAILEKYTSSLPFGTKAGRKGQDTTTESSAQERSLGKNITRLRALTAEMERTKQGEGQNTHEENHS